MVHYTCDVCGRSIRDERFIVKIEVSPTFDSSEITEEDLDVDHLDELVSEIEKLESTGEFEIPVTGPKLFQYDLCAQCCQQYSQAPLASPVRPRVTYSEN